MSNMLNNILNTIADEKISATEKYSEWYGMSAQERESWLQEANRRIFDIQQTSLNVLAAQYYDMQGNPSSISDHLTVLKNALAEVEQRIAEVGSTPAREYYKQQLQGDIGIYQRQQTSLNSYETSWGDAAKILNGEHGDNANNAQLVENYQEKTKTLSDKVDELQTKVNTMQTTEGTDNLAFIKLAAELAAYKDFSVKYKDFATRVNNGAEVKDPRVVPASSDALPLNATLLLMEERPGYIRMNIALVDANYDQTQKEMYLDDAGQLVIQSRKAGGDINFSFGTAARSLAWYQNYRLNPQPGGTPTYAPIRSVLVKTEFVRKYFGSYMESEHSQRNELKARLTDDGLTMKLVNVDRKIPNQVGVTVDLDGTLQDIINQNADLSSFQTIAPNSYRDTQYNPDRDGAFLSIEEFAQSVGFRESQYLLELMKTDSAGNVKYLPATPFALIEQDENGKFIGGHLSKSETEELYRSNQAFFEKVEQLQDGTAKDRAWYKSPTEREAFVQQLTRLLDRNHITPANLLLESDSNRERRRDGSGNSYNKVAWERDFATSYLENTAVKSEVFALSTRLLNMVESNGRLIDRALSTGYVLSDLGAARQQMGRLSELLLERAQTAEAARVDGINRNRDPRDPRAPEVYNELNVRRSVDKELLLALLGGADRVARLSSDPTIQQAITAELSASTGQSLRTQLLFHVLRPMAEELQNGTNPPTDATNPHQFDNSADSGDADKVLIGNRLPVVDAYRLLNTDPRLVSYFDGTYVINDDKQRSYNQYQPDPSRAATAYMDALDTPFTGGISGTTRVVSSHLTSLFGSMTLTQYWQFQLANAALMIRNGYHSFFEALYVAARYEPQAEGRVGPQMLELFDTLKAAGEKGFDLKGQLYTETMKLLLPIVEAGAADGNRYKVPEYATLAPKSIIDEVLQKLGDTVVDRRQFDTLQERIDLVKDVYQRLTREKALDGQNLTPGFEQLTPTELNGLNLEEVKHNLLGKIDDYIQAQKNAGHNPPASLTDEQKTRLVELAVEGIVRQDINKRAELLTYLEGLGFSLHPKNGTDRLLTFWSDDHEGYKHVLNGKLAEQGKPGIATDFDVTALSFVHMLREGISGIVKASNPPDSPIMRAADQGSITIAGFLSSVYAANTAELGGTVYVMSKGGLKVNNFFWNVELPILRSLQKAGAIGEIRILHEPFSDYENKPLTEIGSLLTANDVGVLANYKYLPQWLADEKFAALHKQWLDTKVKANLIELHKELRNYIEQHIDSGRIPAMKELLRQTDDKLFELDEFDGLTTLERIDAARGAPAGNKVTLWSVDELLDKASVLGKKRGESYQRIMSLLEQVSKDSKPSAFRFPDVTGQSPYVTLEFHGDVIDNYSDQIKRLLPFNLLRETWGVVVRNDSSTGGIILSSGAGGESRINVPAAQTIEQKVERKKQIAALERFLLANFTSQDIPAQLAFEGDRIKSGDRVLAERKSGIWETYEAAVDAVRSVPNVVGGGLNGIPPLNNSRLYTWLRPDVEPTNDGGDSRYDAQIIFQTENDPVVAKAAANLAGKHPENSVIIQLGADGSMWVVYGDPSLLRRPDGGTPKVRWQIVGHGRTAADGSQTLGGLAAKGMVTQLGWVTDYLVSQYGVDTLPSRISLVGCSLGKDSDQESFGLQFTRELKTPGLEVSVHTSDVAVDSSGRKRTLNGDGNWVHKASDEKLVLQWQEEGEVLRRKERTEGALLVGRDGIDVGQLFKTIHDGQQSVSDLSAAQQYALSQFFPDELGQLDRLGLQESVSDPVGYTKLQDDITRLILADMPDVRLGDISLSPVLMHDLGARINGKPVTEELLLNLGNSPESVKITFDPERFADVLSRVPTQPELEQLRHLLKNSLAANGNNIAELFGKTVADNAPASLYVQVLTDSDEAALEVVIAGQSVSILGEKAAGRAQWLSMSAGLDVNQRRQLQNLYVLATDTTGFDLAGFNALKVAKPNFSDAEILQQMALNVAEKRLSPGNETDAVMQLAKWTDTDARQFLMGNNLINSDGAGAVNVNKVAFENFIKTCDGMDRIRLSSAMMKLSPDVYLRIKNDLKADSSETLGRFIDDVNQQRSNKHGAMLGAVDKVGTGFDVYETLNSVRQLVSGWSQMTNVDKGLTLTELVGGVAVSPLSAAVSKALGAAGKALGAAGKFGNAIKVVKAGVLDVALAPVTFASIGLQWESFWSANGDTNSYEYKSLVANTVMTTVTTAVSLALTGVSIAASLSSAVAASVLGTIAAAAGPIGVAIAAAGFIINGVVQGAMQLAEFGDYFSSTADKVAQFFAAWVGVETDGLKRARVEKAATGDAERLHNSLNGEWEKTRLYLSDLFSKDGYKYLQYRERDNAVVYASFKWGGDYAYVLQQQTTYGEVKELGSDRLADGDQVWAELGNSNAEFVATGSAGKRNLFNLNGAVLRAANGDIKADAFNLSATTKITAVDGKAGQDSLLLDAGGLTVTLTPGQGEQSTLTYSGNLVLMDNLEHRSGDRGANSSTSEPITQNVNQRTTVAGIESYIVKNAGKADIRGSAADEFFDISGSDVTVAGGEGSNTYSLNQGNKILSSGNDSVLWNGQVDASVTLQGISGKVGQTLLVSLSSRYSDIKVRRNGTSLQLLDGYHVLTINGVYKEDGTLDTSKALQLLDPYGYSFSLPGLGLIDGNATSLTNMAKTFVFDAKAGVEQRQLSNDMAVNTYTLQAGAGSFIASPHTNQLMQFVLEVPLSALRYTLVDDALVIRSIDPKNPLALTIRGYQEALKADMIKLWLSPPKVADQGLQIVAVKLPDLTGAKTGELVQISMEEVEALAGKETTNLKLPQEQQHVQLLDLSQATQSVTVDAVFLAQKKEGISLLLPSTASVGKLMQLRVADDLILYYADQASSKLSTIPHLKIQGYFRQNIPITLNHNDRNSTLTVQPTQHLGDANNNQLSGANVPELAGMSGSDTYSIPVRSSTLTRWVINNFATDSMRDTLDLGNDVGLDQLQLVRQGDDLEIRIQGPVSKTIVLQNYVVDTRTQHLQLKLGDQTFMLPAVEPLSGYFVHPTGEDSGMLGAGTHLMRVPTQTGTARRTLYLSSNIAEYRQEVLGYDLKLSHGEQTLFLRDYYRNPDAVRFAWQGGSNEDVQIPEGYHVKEQTLFKELKVPRRDWVAWIENNVTSREQVSSLLALGEERGSKANDLGEDMPNSTDFTVYVKLNNRINSIGPTPLFATGENGRNGFSFYLDAKGYLCYKAYTQNGNYVGTGRTFYSESDRISSSSVAESDDDEIVITFGGNNELTVSTPKKKTDVSMKVHDNDPIRFAETRYLSNKILNGSYSARKVMDGLANDSQIASIFRTEGQSWGARDQDINTWLKVKGFSQSGAEALIAGGVTSLQNLREAVSALNLANGRLSERFIVAYVKANQSWLHVDGAVVFAQQLASIGKGPQFTFDAWRYGLSALDVVAYAGVEALYPGQDRLADFALALRGDDKALNGDFGPKYRFEPKLPEDFNLLKQALIYKGYLPARAEALAEKLALLGVLNYQALDSLMKVGIQDRDQLLRLLKEGVNGEDIIAANSHGPEYESGNRGSLIQVSTSGILSQFSSVEQTVYYAREYLGVDKDGNVTRLGANPTAEVQAGYNKIIKPGPVLGAGGGSPGPTEIARAEGEPDGVAKLWEQGYIDRSVRYVPSEQSWFGRSTPENLVDGSNNAGDAFAWRAASIAEGKDGKDIYDVPMNAPDLNDPDTDDRAAFIRFDLKHKVALSSLTLHTAYEAADKEKLDTSRSGSYRVEALNADANWVAVSSSFSWNGQDDVMRVSIDTRDVPYQSYRLRGMSGSYDRDRWIKEVEFTTVPVKTVAASEPGARVEVAIKNASFEAKVLASDSTLDFPVFDWELQGSNSNVGIYKDQNELHVIGGASEGLNMMSISGGGSIKQTLGENFDATADYQLSVDLAYDKVESGASGFGVRLWAGDSQLYAVDLSAEQAKEQLGYGKWNTLTLNVDGPTHQALSNQALRVEIVNLEDINYFKQVNVDNIRLAKLTGAMATFGSDAAIADGSALFKEGYSIEPVLAPVVS
jgi:hypothetical protein